MKRIPLPVLLGAILLSVSPGARAQTEVTLIAPGGIRSAIEQLIPGFEQKSGYKVNATFGSGGGTKQQVVRGEAFDVPIVQPPYPDVCAWANVVKRTATPRRLVGGGVQAKQGAPNPDNPTPDASRNCCSMRSRSP